MKEALNLVKQASSSEEFQRCVLLLSQSISQTPDSAILYSYRGRCYEFLRQFQRALFDFSMAIRVDPDNPRWLSSRGVCFRHLERLPEAKRDFSDAIRLERVSLGLPEYDDMSYESNNKSNMIVGSSLLAGLYLQRGITEEFAGDLNAALRDLSTSISLNYAPLEIALLRRGVTYRKLGHLECSLQDLRRAILLNSSISDLHEELGITYTKASQWNEAVSCFNHAAGSNHMSRRLLYLRANCLFELKDFEKAMSDMNAAISTLEEITDEHCQLFYDRGRIYTELGHPEYALRDVSIAHEFDSVNPLYLYHLGLIHQRMKRYKDAISAFERAGEYEPARLHLAAACHMDGNLGRAKSLLDGWSFQTDFAYWHLKGLIAKDLGELQEADEYISKAIDLSTSSNVNDTPLYRLFHERAQIRGKTLSAIEDYDKAVESLNRMDDSINRKNDLANIYFERGSCRYSWSEEEGEEDVEKAISLLPDLLFFYNRGILRMSCGNLKNAEKDFGIVLETSQSSDAFYYRGVVRFRLKNWNTAIEDFHRALASIDSPYLTSSPDIQAELFYYLGCCLANNTRYHEANLSLTKCIDLLDGLKGTVLIAAIHERAKTLQELNNHPQAIEDFNTVLKHQPNNARARFRRGFSLKAVKKFQLAAEDFEAAKDTASLLVEYRSLKVGDFQRLGPAGEEDTNFE